MAVGWLDISDWLYDWYGLCSSRVWQPLERQTFVFIGFMILYPSRPHF